MIFVTAAESIRLHRQKNISIMSGGHEVASRDVNEHGGVIAILQRRVELGPLLYTQPGTHHRRPGHEPVEASHGSQTVLLVVAFSDSHAVASAATVVKRVAQTLTETMTAVVSQPLLQTTLSGFATELQRGLHEAVGGRHMLA